MCLILEDKGTKTFLESGDTASISLFDNFFTISFYRQNPHEPGNRLLFEPSKDDKWRITGNQGAAISICELIADLFGLNCSMLKIFANISELANIIAARIKPKINELITPQDTRARSLDLSSLYSAIYFTSAIGMPIPPIIDIIK